MGFEHMGFPQMQSFDATMEKVLSVHFLFALSGTLICCLAINPSKWKKKKKLCIFRNRNTFFKCILIFFSERVIWETRASPFKAPLPCLPFFFRHTGPLALMQHGDEVLLCHDGCFVSLSLYKAVSS